MGTTGPDPAGGEAVSMAGKPGNGSLRLEPVQGPALAGITVVAGDPMLVGRGSEATVLLADPQVSRRHAQLIRRGGRWELRDLGSRHGTLINTIRLDPDESVRLAEGDLIGIGPWTLAVSLGDDPAAEQAVEPDTGRRTTGTGPRTGGGPTVARDDYATRATMFDRLNDERSEVRQLTWEEFVDRYSRIIVGFARNAGLPAHDADDVLQDVLLGFFRVSDRFEYDRSKGRFRGYLKRVTLNAIRARSRRARPVAGLDDAPAPLEDDRASALFEVQWTRSLLEQALAEVRPQFGRQAWEAFELYGRRQMPAEAVAVQLGTSVENVRHAKSRVARAVRDRIERSRDREE